VNDTDPAIAERYRTSLLARSGEERLKMGCSMYAAAQALVRAAIRERHPQASPGAVRQELFRRFYGQDFDAAAQETILRALGEEEQFKKT
jgi:hypothetical protein